MRQCTTSGFRRVTGIDLGDRRSVVCVLDADGEVVDRSSVVTTSEAFETEFSQEPGLFVIEAGTHSRWVSALLKRLGHEVIVANPRRVSLIHRDHNKTDQVDAEKLARLGRADPRLLYPIEHRGAEAQEHLEVIQARECLVDTRKRLINVIRSSTKGFGVQLPKGVSTPAFPTKMVDQIPEALGPALLPLFETLEVLNRQIQEYDRKIDSLGTKTYPETWRLRQISGVGPLVSLAFVLTLEDPRRFRRSRSVGPFLGLTPRKDDSGDRSPQLRITKAGNCYLRKLLVSSAHYILGRHGPDCDLRRYGLKIIERGGKYAKKRAIVAVARKLAVLLHRLWRTGEVYEPLRSEKQSRKAS